MAILTEICFLGVGLGVVFILLLYIIFALLPTLLFRAFAAFVLKPIFRSDLFALISPLSNVFAQPEDTASKSLILVQGNFKGRLDFETFLTAVEERLINCGKYPELRCAIVSWIGFKWFRPEDNFKLRDHVRKVTLSKGEKLEDLKQSLLCNPFPAPGRAPWEFVVVVGEETTVVFQRFSHALADGYSNLFMTQQLFNSELSERNKPPLNSRKSKSNQNSGIMTLSLKALREFGRYATSILTPMTWEIPEQEKSPNWSTGLSQKIPNSKILKIKRAHGVSFSAVVFALVGGGVVRFLKKNKAQVTAKSFLPTAITLPVREYQDRLLNQFAFAIVKYPMDLSDPVQRLMKIDAELEDLRDSPAPSLYHYLLKLFGYSFTFVGKALSAKQGYSSITSYVPIMSRCSSLLGHPLQDMFYHLRLQLANPGAVFCILGLSNYLRISLTVNGALLSPKEVAELASAIDQEVEELFQSIANVDVQK